jgi:hypothetical protein
MSSFSAGDLSRHFRFGGFFNSALDAMGIPRPPRRIVRRWAQLARLSSPLIETGAEVVVVTADEPRGATRGVEIFELI